MAKQRKKSGFLGKFIAALLGFFLGIVATIGGIGGAGYYIVAHVPIKDGVDTVGGWTGSSIDYRDYLTEEFASNTILGAIEEITSFAAELGEGTASLSSLERFSPLVRTKIAELTSQIAAFGVPVDLDTLMSTPFLELQAYATELIDNTEIGKVAGEYLGNVGGGILKMLSYGEEGFEFIMEDIDGDGKADFSLLGNNKPTIVKDLTMGDIFNGVLGHISVSALMRAAGTAQVDDLIFRAVLYGEENVDYIVVGDTIQMLPRLYAYEPVNNAFMDMESEQVFTQDDSNWTNATLGYTISTVSGEYDYAVTDGNGDTVEYLKATAIPNAYEVYRLSQLDTARLQLRRGLTLGKLLSGGFNAEELLYKINVGDLLDLNGESPSMLLSVAYGKEGVDYTVDPTTKEIIPITEPTKIGDLMDVDGLTEKLYDLYLADLMDVDPLNPNADSMTVLLAYGEEGVHYELKDTNNDGLDDTIVWLTYTDAEGTHYYGKRTIGDLIADGKDIFSGISVATIMQVNANSAPLLINLAYGPASRYTIENGKFIMNPVRFQVINDVAYDDLNAAYDGADGNGTTTNLGGGVYKVQNWMSTYYISEDGGVYYAYATQEAAQAGVASTRLTYQKIMLSSLRGSEAGLFLANIELGAALGVQPTSTDKLMVALAYGYDGEQFTISNGNVIWNTNPATGLPYRPRTLNDLNNAKEIVQTIKISDFIDNTNDNPLLKTFAEKGWTVADLTAQNINDLELGEVLSIDNSDVIMSALKTAKIGELESEIMKLTVYQLLGDHAEENRFIKHIKDTPIGQIEIAMNELTVVEVFDDKVYKTEVVGGVTYYFDAENTQNRLYYNQADGKYYKDMAFTQEGVRALTGCWKYMLSDANGVKAYDEYTFNDFDAMINNMTHKIEHATLVELSADGVLSLEGVNMSQSTIMGVSIASMTGDPTKTTLGALSLIDLLTLIATIP